MRGNNLHFRAPWITCLVEKHSESRLRKFLVPTLPAAAAELVFTLNTKEYLNACSGSASVPDLTEIAKALCADLARQVSILSCALNLLTYHQCSHVQIRGPLGYPDSYRKRTTLQIQIGPVQFPPKFSGSANSQTDCTESTMPDAQFEAQDGRSLFDLEPSGRSEC